MNDSLAGSAEVARILGVSRQRVAKLATSSPGFPAPLAELAGGRVWARDAIEAWAASHQDRGLRRRQMLLPPPGDWAPEVRTIALRAGRLAFELEHGGVSARHLLLALLDPTYPSVAGRVLASFGITFDEWHRRVVEAFPRRDAAPGGRWSPKAQLVLERANLKAIELEDEEVGSEHVLLALIDAAERDGVIPEFGPSVSPAAVRERVVKFTEGGADSQT